MVVGRKQRRVERHPVEFVRLLLLADDFALFEPQQRIPYLHGTGIGHAGLGVAVQPAEHVRPFLVAIREVHAGHGVVFGGADQRIREGQGPGVLPVPDGIEITFAVVAHAGEVEPVGLVRTDEPALQEKVHAGRTPEFVVALGLRRRKPRAPGILPGRVSVGACSWLGGDCEDETCTGGICLVEGYVAREVPGDQAA